MVERGRTTTVSSRPSQLSAAWAVHHPLGWAACNWRSGALEQGRTLKGPFARNRMEMGLIEQISASNCCITLIDAPLCRASGGEPPSVLIGDKTPCITATGGHLKQRGSGRKGMLDWRGGAEPGQAGLACTEPGQTGPSQAEPGQAELKGKCVAGGNAVAPETLSAVQVNAANCVSVRVQVQRLRSQKNSPKVIS